MLGKTNGAESEKSVISSDMKIPRGRGSLKHVDVMVPAGRHFEDVQVLFCQRRKEGVLLRLGRQEVWEMLQNERVGANHFTNFGKL